MSASARLTRAAWSAAVCLVPAALLASRPAAGMDDYPPSPAIADTCEPVPLYVMDSAELLENTIAWHGHLAERHVTADEPEGLNFDQLLTGTIAKEWAIDDLDICCSPLSGHRYQLVMFDRLIWIEPYVFESDDAELPYGGFHRHSNRTYVASFDKDGLIADCLGFDRAVDLVVLYGRDLGIERDLVWVSTFLDGVFVYELTEGGLFRFMHHLPEWSAANDFFLCDVDGDGSYEALVSAMARVLSRTAGFYLADIDQAVFGDGTEFTGEGQGFIAIELDGESQQPFTYYPELVFR